VTVKVTVRLHHGIPGIAQQQPEGFIGLIERIPANEHGDCLTRGARREGQGAMHRLIVTPRQCGVILGLEVHHHTLPARYGETYCKDGGLHAAVALSHLDIGYPERGERIIIGDGAYALGISQHCVGGIAEDHLQDFLGFVQGIIE
jgi:hypothetical protein